MACFANGAQAGGRAVIVMDGSGSMLAHATSDCGAGSCQVGGSYRRIDQAKRIARGVTKKFTADHYDLSLIIFGGRGGQCNDIEVMAGFGSLRSARSKIDNAIDDLNARGATPLAESIKRAGELVKKGSFGADEIIVITDGLESCQGDPIGVARELKQKHGIKTSIVSLGTGARNVPPQLAAIAEAGGGWAKGDEADAELGTNDGGGGSASEVEFSGEKAVTGPMLFSPARKEEPPKDHLILPGGVRN